MALNRPLMVVQVRHNYSNSHRFVLFFLLLCFAERCSRLPSIAGGIFSRSDQNNFLSIANLACYAAYKFTDPHQSKTACQANGNWTLPFPNCEGKFS